MKYEKSHLSFDDQADLLIGRGLQADRDVLISRLQAVSYYRLDGYLFRFREPASNPTVYRPGTTLDEVWRRYRFDRRLRLLVMDAVERIEVSIRTRIVYEFTSAHGPFGYLDPANLPRLRNHDHEAWLCSLCDEVWRSQELFMEHFRTKYGDNHTAPPLWIMSELMSMGNTVRLYKGMDQAIRSSIAAKYKIPQNLLESWLLTLNTVRNIAAHHSRLWDREFTRMKPKIPRPNKYPEWHNPEPIDRSRIFAILTICRYLLQYIAPQSRWTVRLFDLFAEFDDVPLSDMGFPMGWEYNKIWGKSRLV